MNQQNLTQKQRFALSQARTSQQRQSLLRSYNMQRSQNRGQRRPFRRFNGGFFRNNNNNRGSLIRRRGFSNFRNNNGGRIINPRGSLTNKVSIPRSYGFNIINPESSTYNIQRTAIIGEIEFAQTDNYFAKRINIHPGNIPWVSAISKSFDKYRFVNFRVRLLPNVGTNCNGAAFIGFNYENHHVIALNFNEAQSYDKFTSSPVWSESGWISVPTNVLSDKWYDTTYEIRNGSANNVKGDTFHDFSPGRIIVGYHGISGVANGVTLSRVEVSYNLVLSRPTLNNQVIPDPKPPSKDVVSVEEITESFVSVDIDS